MKLFCIFLRHIRDLKKVMNIPKNSLLLILLLFCIQVKSQYLCDYELRVLNKQKKQVRKECVLFAKTWIKNHRDSLNIPKKIKLSPFKFQPRPDEYEKGEYNHINQWEAIDSLLCVNERKTYVNTAKEKLREQKLTVYEISTSFTPVNAENPEIGSSLYFQYGIDGKNLRIILRIKTLSKTSEVFFH